MAGLPAKTYYVAGLLFSDPGPTPSILLIRKLRPEKQRGLLNGIGGHVEPGETAVQAMVREFVEEAGVLVSNWEHVGQLVHNEWEIAWFRAYGDPRQARAQTDEELVVCKWPLDPAVARMPHLDWLVPMCMNQSGLLFPVTMQVATIPGPQ